MPRRLLRPEWVLAALLFGAALLVQVTVRPPIASLSFELYYQLASAFTSGVVLCLLVVLGERILARLDAVSRPRGLWIWRLATAALALTVFLTFHPPRATLLTRLLESTALSLAGTVTLVALFLPVSGLVRPRDLFCAVAEVIGRWLPLLVYLVAAGPLMSATLISTPLVLDPVLLRMDLSLGFNPSEAIFAWEYHLDWVRLLCLWGYPLLGIFLASVTATLHLAGAAAESRRCLLALALVACGGLVCYQLAPALGPLHAFPQLFQTPATTPELAAHAAELRSAIVNGPDRIPGSLAHPRNVMPSLHTAFTLVVLAAAWSWRRRCFWLCLPVGLVQIFTALALCVHYAVDIIAAVPFAAACWALADWLIRRAPVDGETPLAAPAQERPRAFWVSLGTALVALLLWGEFAPLPPAVAWPLVALIAGVPAWLSLRSDRRKGAA